MSAISGFTTLYTKDFKVISANYCVHERSFWHLPIITFMNAISGHEALCAADYRNSTNCGTTATNCSKLIKVKKIPLPADTWSKITGAPVSDTPVTSNL